MKRTIFIIALMLGAISMVFAQKKINEKIEVGSETTTMEFSFADNIILEAWNKDFIELNVEIDIDDNKFNEQYSLEIDKNGQSVKLIENIDFDKIKKLKGDKKLCNFNTDINYSLKVPQNLKLSLETISGEVELIGCKGEMKIKSISGFIDYSIPSKHKAKVALSTVTGDVYSNVNFDNKLPEKISWVGTNEELSLNGGDTDVKLKTVSGDIYLRKY